MGDNGADRDRTGDPLLAKPNEKVPGFYKLLNLRAVLGIGVEVEGPIGALHCEKLTTNSQHTNAVSAAALGVVARAPSSGPQPRQGTS